VVAAVEVAEESTQVDPGAHAAREAGMNEMSEKFRKMGNNVYVDAEKAEAAKKLAG
jgi:phosphomethylpyrimidine synthase